MNLSPTGDSLLVIIVLVFVAVLLLLEGLYLLWRRYQGGHARKLEERLRNFGAASARAPQAKLIKRNALSGLPVLQKLLANAPGTDGVERWIAQAGLSWTVFGLVLGSVAAGLATALAMSILVRFGGAGMLAGGAAGASLPLLYVAWSRARRFRQLERQLPDALDLLCRALRAGHTFSSALNMVADEMPEPSAGEFRLVRDEVNFGIALHQALANLTLRAPLVDLRYFSVAVLIQRESGGNLTEILAKLAALIRERHRLRGRIRVLSAEGRMSAWVLGVMPFAMAGLMNVVNPEFMSPLWTDPIGLTIIQYTLGMMAIGIVVLIRVVKIRV